MKSIIKYLLTFVFVAIFSLCFIACKKEKEIIKVKNIGIVGNTEMVVGEEQVLSYTIDPEDATNKNVLWSVSNEKYATISETGTIKAVKAGKVTVYCEATDNSNAMGELLINIINPEEVVLVSNIIITGKKTMAIGSKQELVVEVFPQDANNKELTWSSSDENICTVFNGKIEALKLGTATITAKANDNSNVTKDFIIEVVEAIDAIDAKVDCPTNIEIGEEKTVSVTLEPSNASSDINYASSDDSILTIDSFGSIKGISKGEATITITIKASTPFTKTFTVKVTDSLIDVSEIQNLLNSIYNDYKESSIGSCKMTVTNGDKISTLVYKYSFSDDLTTVNELEYNLDNNLINSIYVRKNIIYMSANNSLGKYEIDKSEHKSFIQSYSFDKFFSSSLVYKSDKSFFESLELDSYEDYTNKNNCTYTYNLNLSEYDGNTLNLVGLDSVKLVVTLVNGDISVIEYVASEGLDVKSIKVEFLGKICDIVYPSQLDDYPVME